MLKGMIATVPGCYAILLNRDLFQPPGIVDGSMRLVWASATSLPSYGVHLLLRGKAFFRVVTSVTLTGLYKENVRHLMLHQHRSDVRLRKTIYSASCASILEWWYISGK